MKEKLVILLASSAGLSVFESNTYFVKSFFVLLNDVFSFKLVDFLSI